MWIFQFIAKNLSTLNYTLNARVSKPHFNCEIHKFNTTSLKQWKKHLLTPDLQHKINGVKECTKCGAKVPLDNILIANLEKFPCPSCGKINDFTKDLFPSDTAKPITVNEYLELERLMQKYGSPTYQDPDSAKE